MSPKRRGGDDLDVFAVSIVIEPKGECLDAAVMLLRSIVRSGSETGMSNGLGPMVRRRQPYSWCGVVTCKPGANIA